MHKRVIIVLYLTAFLFNSHAPCLSIKHAIGTGINIVYAANCICGTIKSLDATRTDQILEILCGSTDATQQCKVLKMGILTGIALGLFNTYLCYDTMWTKKDQKTGRFDIEVV